MTEDNNNNNNNNYKFDFKRLLRDPVTFYTEKTNKKNNIHNRNKMHLWASCKIRLNKQIRSH